MVHKTVIILLFILLDFLSANSVNLDKILGETKVTWNYHNASFFDVVSDVQKKHRVNVAVDTKVTSTLLRIKSNVNVKLALYDVTLKNALDIFLDIFDLVYTYRNQSIFITYPNSPYVSKAPETRSYDVHELVPKVQADFPELPADSEMLNYIDPLKNTLTNSSNGELEKLIKDVIARQSWANEVNSISTLSGNMFISHQASIHEEIDKLFIRLFQGRPYISIDLQVLEVEEEIIKRDFQNFYSPQIATKNLRRILSQIGKGVRVVSQSTSVESAQRLVFFNDINDQDPLVPKVFCVLKPSVLSSGNTALVEFFSTIEKESNAQSKKVAYQNLATSFIVPLNTKVCVAISPFSKGKYLVFLIRLSILKKKKIIETPQAHTPLPEAFEKKLSLNFSNYPLTNVIEEIRANTRANIVLDPQIFTQVIGDEESFRVTFHVDSMTVKEILNLLESMTRLRVIRRGNVLVITTPQRYPFPPELKLYNISDIVFSQKSQTEEERNFEQQKLISILRNAVPRESWKDNRNGIGIWEGSLAVRQNLENHAKIKKKISFLQKLYTTNLQPVTVWSFLVRDQEIQPKSLSIVQGRNREKLFFSGGVKWKNNKDAIILEATPYIKSNNKIGLEILWKSWFGRYSQRSVKIEIDDNTSALVGTLPSANSKYQLFVGARIPKYKIVEGAAKVDVQHSPKIAVLDRDFKYTVEISNTGTSVAKNSVAVIKIPPHFQHTSGMNVFTIPIGDLEERTSRTIDLPLKAIRYGKADVIVHIQSQGADVLPFRFATEVKDYKAKLKVKSQKIRFIKRRTPIIFRVENNGDLPINNVQVNTSLASGISIVSADSNSEIVNQNITWNVPRIAPGAAKDLTAIVRSGKPGKFKISTSMSSDEIPKVVQEYHKEWRGFPAVTVEGQSIYPFIRIDKTTQYNIKLHNRGTASDTNIKIRLECSPELRPIEVLGKNKGVIQGQFVIFDTLQEVKAGEKVSLSTVLQGIEGGIPWIKLSFVSDNVKKPITEEDRINVIE